MGKKSNKNQNKGGVKKVEERQPQQPAPVITPVPVVVTQQQPQMMKDTKEVSSTIDNNKVTKVTKEEEEEKKKKKGVTKEGVNNNSSKELNKVKKSNEVSTTNYDLKELKGFKALPVTVDSGLNSKGSNEVKSELTTLHYLYYKPHQSKDQSNSQVKPSYEAEDTQLLPPGRTLYLTNLPLDCTEKDLTELFNNPKLAGVGQVTRVLLRTPNSLAIDLKLTNTSNQNNKSDSTSKFVKKATTPLAKEFSELFPTLNTTGKLIQTSIGVTSLLTYPNYAYLVFKKPTGLQNVLNHQLQLPTNSNGSSPDLSQLIKVNPSVILSLTCSGSVKAESGLERWLRQYDLRRPNPSRLQPYLDEYMNEFNHHLELQQYKESLTMDMPDEDGFVKVVRGRTRNATEDGATVRAIPKADAKALSLKIAGEKRRQAEREADGSALTFYRTQARDSKKYRLTQLRAQFELDKQRIAEMKLRNQFQLQ